MRIAIIGAGIAGLTAARRLHPKHRITVFEANDYLGGHTNTVEVELDGMRHFVDTGFIVFNKRNYPRFTKLVDHLQVGYQDSPMSFAVTGPKLEYQGSSVNGLFAQRSNIVNPAFHKMLWDIVRFNSEASRQPVPHQLTLGDYLTIGGYGQGFTNNYIVPLGAAIWSATPASMLEFPAHHFIQFLRNHGLLTLSNRPQWKTITGGAKNYVEALVAPFRKQIRLGTPIHEVLRQRDCVSVTTANGREEFDWVIFACHSNQALKILADESNAEREILSDLPFQENVAILHTDIRLLPRRKRAWAAWNYLVSPAHSNHVAVTYNLNILQSLPFTTQCLVTLNAEQEIEPNKIIKQFIYHHPSQTLNSVAAQGRHSEISGVNRTSYCGAYWGYGFHEDGVTSGERVADQLNAR